MFILIQTSLTQWINRQFNIALYELPFRYDSVDHQSATRKVTITASGSFPSKSELICRPSMRSLTHFDLSPTHTYIEIEINTKCNLIYELYELTQ